MQKQVLETSIRRSLISSGNKVFFELHLSFLDHRI
jgi:hypothetical protein